MKYQSAEKVVDAIQWTPELGEIFGVEKRLVFNRDTPIVYTINTSTGNYALVPGDYIIIDGETAVDICDSTSFESRYIQIQEATTN